MLWVKNLKERAAQHVTYNLNYFCSHHMTLPGRVTDDDDINTPRALSSLYQAPFLPLLSRKILKVSRNV
jgi:hypothetical protein